MSSYGGSRHGSRDNLDEYSNRPSPQPRQPPVPQARDRSYERQYHRNPPAPPQAEPQAAPQPQSRGAPPSYGIYADQSRAPVDRYGERPPPRSHSPGRLGPERPQDAYYPSRDQSPASRRDASPASYRGQQQPYQPSQRQRERSQSPGRTLDVGYSPNYPPSQSGYAPSQSGYAPSQSGYAPSQSGYAPSQSGYAASQSGYAPSQGGYNQQPQGGRGGYSQGQGYAPSQGYAPQQGYGYNNGRARGQSTSSGHQQGGRAPAYSQSSQYYPSRGPTRTYNGYEQFGRGGYATRHSKPKHKTVTRDGGYYNVYTDAVVKTKKMKTKGGTATFLTVTRPWSKNHSNQPRDFMPLVIASVFFNPVLGLISLILSCITKRAVTSEDWAKAGLFGRITFWMAIAAIITGIIFFAVLIGSVHNGFVPPNRH